MTRLFLSLLFVCCITLATWLGPAFQRIQARNNNSTSPLVLLLGESRQLFANQFFTMADEYFHSGYYPTIFDAKKSDGPTHLDMSSHEEANSGKKEPDDDDAFMGPPRDWIESFGRNFFPTTHTHLAGSNAREILPWLKLATELDPHRVEAYVTAAYWLRTRLNQPKEAEEFLRQGLRANPDSYEIYLELGRVYFYSKGDVIMARNLWRLGLKKWDEQDKAGKKPDPDVHQELLGELVRDDEKQGDLRQEIADLQELQKRSPNPGSIEESINKLEARLAR